MVLPSGAILRNEGRSFCMWLGTLIKLMTSPLRQGHSGGDPYRLSLKIARALS
jgi:hypothetical protein